MTLNTGTAGAGTSMAATLDVNGNMTIDAANTRRRLQDPGHRRRSPTSAPLKLRQQCPHRHPQRRQSRHQHQGHLHPRPSRRQRQQLHQRRHHQRRLQTSARRHFQRRRQQRPSTSATETTPSRPSTINIGTGKGQRCSSSSPSALFTALRHHRLRHRRKPTPRQHHDGQRKQWHWHHGPPATSTSAGHVANVFANNVLVGLS